MLRKLRHALFLSIVLAVPAAAQGTDALIKAISASRIVAISDGDFIGQTYADAVLAPVDAGFQDVLTVIATDGAAVRSGTLRVSNSVTAAPEILDLSPDGRIAYVTERLGERGEGATRTPDLPVGNRLFAVDLGDPTAPALTATAEVIDNPEALAVSPDGHLVAVVGNTPEQSRVDLVGVAKNGLGTVHSFDLADLGVTGTTEGPRGGVTATNVQWHPSGAILAVNVNTQNRVAFFRVSENEGKPMLEPWGSPVEVGRDPFVGRFTPDGGYYLTSNWGRNFAAKTLNDRIPTEPSTITVVRLGDIEANEPLHEATAHVETGLSPEGIAVSADGRLVATVNMGPTALTGDRAGREATVSLHSFDPATGTLVKVDEKPFEGVLPEGGVFDATGTHFLATVFQGQQGHSERNGPGLEVFRISRGDRPQLEAIGRIAMPHGVHHVDIVP